MTLTEVEYALEQAAIHRENEDYDNWARAAYIGTFIHNSNAGKGSKKIKKVSELIGEHPSKVREKKQKQNKIDLDNKEALRKLALDKGLDINF
jgi:hypothetical protein